MMEVKPMILGDTCVPQHDLILDFKCHEKILELLRFQVLVPGRDYFTDKRIKFVINPSIESIARYINNPETDNAPFLEQDLEFVIKTAKVNRPFACALSGGLDSSTVAIYSKPDVCYTGYYDVEGYDERKYARAVTQQLGCEHYEYLLTEKDFLNNLDDYLDIIRLPVAGPGGVMEYACLNKLRLQRCDIKDVLFGNGGDEVCGAYMFNQLYREFFRICQPRPILSEFWPQRQKIVKELANYVLMGSMCRDDYRTHATIWNDLLDSISIAELRPLFVNLVMTLPTLIYMVSSIAKKLGFEAHNPLSSYAMIFNAKKLYQSDPDEPITKNKLRQAARKLPAIVWERNSKMGFPIPFHEWKEVSALFFETWQKARSSFKWLNLGDYPGVNRLSWAVLCLMRIYERNGNV